VGYTTNGVSSQPHAGATTISQNQLGAGFPSSLHPTPQQGQRANSVTGQSTPDPNLNVQTHGQTHTPAEQVLHSPADRWGLQALVRMLRNPNQEANLLADGQDLATLGLELDNPGYVSH
jgi:CCR4-NOT transcription complex subunit 2